MAKILNFSRSGIKSMRANGRGGGSPSQGWCVRSSEGTKRVNFLNEIRDHVRDQIFAIVYGIFVEECLQRRKAPQAKNF